MTNEQQPENARSETRTRRTAGGDDAGQEEVAHRLHEEQAKGYSGTVPDQTPNSAYTVGGVSAGNDTPEAGRSPDRIAQPDAGPNKADADK